MRHIHTSIVSRHLATIGNYKILRTPQPYISNSEEILPTSLVAPIAQLRTNKSSKYTYTKLTPKHIHHHTFTHTTHIISSTSPTYAAHYHPGFMDREAGWWTTSRKIRLPPPTSKGHGSGQTTTTR